MIIKILWVCFLITTAITMIAKHGTPWVTSWLDAFVVAFVPNMIVYCFIFITFCVFGVAVFE